MGFFEYLGSDVTEENIFAHNCLHSKSHSSYHTIGPTLFKIKVLYDAIEEPFCLNNSTNNLQHLKNLSVSQKLLCGEVLQIIKR